MLIPQGPSGESAPRTGCWRGLPSQPNNHQEAPQVKYRNQVPRASHVNEGTGSKDHESPTTGKTGVMRHPTLHLTEDDGITTAYGGLALAAGLVQRLGLAKVLANGLKLLRSRRPFSEADHVLTHVYNLYIGGGCIEDIGYLQGSEAVRRLLGAERLPTRRRRATSCGGSATPSWS